MRVPGTLAGVWTGLLLGLAASAPAPGSAAAPELPLAPIDEPWEVLENLVDAELEGELERVVRSDPRRAALVRAKKLAIGVVDLREEEHVRFARINGRVPLYAASLAKLAILLSVLEAVEQGDVEDSPELQQDLQDMIRVSSNPAATRLIDRIGLDRIEASVRRWRLYDEKRGGGLWVGKRYGRTVRRRGDPVANLSHGATVVQVCRFYYLLATGRLINREMSDRMLDYLVDPGLHHKFVAVLDRVAPRARVYRKSGTWKEWHSDSAIVWGDEWRRYILVVMVQDPGGEAILRGLLPEIEAILKPRVAGPSGPEPLQNR